MNVHVNENCIGCGLCVNMCGSVFLMTEEGVAAARDEIFPEQAGQGQEPAESGPDNPIEDHHSPYRWPQPKQAGPSCGTAPPACCQTEQCPRPSGPGMDRRLRGTNISKKVGRLLRRDASSRCEYRTT